MIEEKDFKIIFEKRCYTLYGIKSKKEIKEDSTDKFKVLGYYVTLENAMKAAVKYRKDRKHPQTEHLKKDVEDFIKCKNDFNNLVMSVYDPIYELKRKILYNK